MWPVVTADSPHEDRASLLGKGQAMSDRDAGFCSGGEELESEGAASAASAPLGASTGDAEADEALSPTDASEDSVDVRVRAIAPPPPPPPPLPASPPRKRKLPEAPKPEGPVVAPPPPKKRRLAMSPVPAAPISGSPFRPWSVEFCDAYPDARGSPVVERLRGPGDAEPRNGVDLERSNARSPAINRMRVPIELGTRSSPSFEATRSPTIDRMRVPIELHTRSSPSLEATRYPAIDRVRVPIEIDTRSSPRSAMERMRVPTEFEPRSRLVESPLERSEARISPVIERLRLPTEFEPRNRFEAHLERSNARRSPARERLREPIEQEPTSHYHETHLERLRIPKEVHARLNTTEAEIDGRYMSPPLREMKSETITSSQTPPCDRLSPHQGLSLRLEPSERRYARSVGHSPRPRGSSEELRRSRIDSLDGSERLRVSPNPASQSMKMEPPATTGAEDTLASRFAFPPTNPPHGGRSTPRSNHPPHHDPHLSPERFRVKHEPPSTPAPSRSGSSDSHFGADSESSRTRVKSEHTATSRGESSGGFSVAALLGGSSEPIATAGPSSKTPSTSSGSQQQQSQQRNYKNMTRERRIEANARERTRVHTISAAFDTLRRAVPAYSHAQKLSKLSVLRVACAYILTLSRAAGMDYSADSSEPSLESCVDLVTRTIHTEGKLRRKRDE